MLIPLHQVYGRWSSRITQESSTAFLLGGIQRGFPIVLCECSSHLCTSSASNMNSALDYPEPIDRHIIGPLPMSMRESISISHFGDLNTSSTGRWCVITNPAGSYIYDGVHSHAVVLPLSVEDAYQTVGPGHKNLRYLTVQLHAGWSQCIHPVDWLLLGSYCVKVICMFVGRTIWPEICHKLAHSCARWAALDN